MSASKVELSKADLIVFPSLDSAVMSTKSTRHEQIVRGSRLKVPTSEVLWDAEPHCLIERQSRCWNLGPHGLRRLGLHDYKSGTIMEISAFFKRLQGLEAVPIRRSGCHEVGRCRDI
jgi:hypothetical protein